MSDTRLVLSRGYTWAEPDYPNIEPTTVFRLASCSKLVTALALHQLIAESKLRPNDMLPVVLPLATPDGRQPTNSAYASGTVEHLLEYQNLLQPRYERRSPEIAAAFGTQLPVRHGQIASYMIARQPLDRPDGKLNDFGYFLAGELIKRCRNASSFLEAISPRLLDALQISHVRSARSLLSEQRSDDARHHSRDLVLQPSVMSPDQPVRAPRIRR